MRLLVPLVLLAAALAALLIVPQDRPILGLSHPDFARGAFGAAMVAALIASGLSRASAAGAARVFGGAALWVVIGLGLVAAYGYRERAGPILEDIRLELDPSGARVRPSGEVVVRRAFGGEFVVPVRVNDRALRLVFDTGASSVVLTAEDAAAAGISPRADDYSAPVSTANGETTAAPARIDRLSVGPIVLRDVRALVAKPGVMRQSLLGMSFLERLRSYGVEGGKLVLKGG